jgi:hypothetical protein
MALPNPNLETLRSIWAWIALIEDQKLRDFARAYMYHLQLSGSAAPDYKTFELEQPFAYLTMQEIRRQWREGCRLEARIQIYELWKEVKPALVPWGWGIFAVVLGGLVAWIVVCV